MNDEKSRDDELLQDMEDADRLDEYYSYSNTKLFPVPRNVVAEARALAKEFADEAQRVATTEKRLFQKFYSLARYLERDEVGLWDDMASEIEGPCPDQPRIGRSRSRALARYVIPPDPDGTMKRAEMFAAAAHELFGQAVPVDRVMNLLNGLYTIETFARNRRRAFPRFATGPVPDLRVLPFVMVALTDEVRLHLKRFPKQQPGMVLWRQRPSIGGVMRFEISSVYPGMLKRYIKPPPWWVEERKGSVNPRLRRMGL